MLKRYEMTYDEFVKLGWIERLVAMDRFGINHTCDSTLLPTLKADEWLMYFNDGRKLSFMPGYILRRDPGRPSRIVTTFEMEADAEWKRRKNRPKPKHQMRTTFDHA